MKNVLILGCGRSGTSMAAGTLAGAGYFMGERLHPARSSNSKGFYESGEINQINEAILAPVVPERPECPGALRQGQRWLAQLPVGTSIPAPPEAVRRRMQRAVAKAPFCFKDPRFCYTLPVWREFLRDTAYLCVFRHPASAAQSIVTECRVMENLHNLNMIFERAIDIWCAIYESILDKRVESELWRFMEYDDFFDSGKLVELSNILGARLDDSFPDPKLRRTTPELSAGQCALAIYEELSGLAG